MDKEKSIVPNQIGYLVLKDDGAVLESGGELKNDEHSANVIMGLLNLTESIDESFMPNSSCERITIDYEEYYYSICMSNRRIYIVKISGSQNGGNTTTATASSSSSNSVYNDASDSAGAVLA